MRKISFCDALNEAMRQEMERDSSVFVYGIGVIKLIILYILYKFGINLNKKLFT